MNYSKYRFNLDMQSYISQIALPVRQHDTGIVLRINLTDGGVPYVIEDGCRAVFCARKADGNPLMSDCVIEKNTTICYELTQQTTACSGVVDCEIRLYGADGNLITTPRFILVVDSRVVHDDDFPLSDSEQTILDNIILSETARQANEVEREKAEAKRESAEAERAKVFNEAEAEREEAFGDALETSVRAQDIADTLTKKLEAGEFLGKSVFIRYSDNAEGTDYTEEWNGEFYIGIAVAVTAPTDKSGYNWTRFYGDPVSFNELTDVPYSYLDVDEDGYLCLSEDKTIGSPMGFVGQIASNALKGNVSGSAVAMKDVSPLEHELGVKVSSKNLIHKIPIMESYNTTKNGVTFIVNEDGSVSLSGTNTAITNSDTYIIHNYESPYVDEKPIPLSAGTYTFSGITSPNDTTSLCRLRINYKNAVGNVFVIDINNLASEKLNTFTIYEDVTIISLTIYAYANARVDGITLKPMLEKGTVATPYAPYLDNISTAEVKRYGKNLAVFMRAVSNATFENGVAIQIEADTYNIIYLKAQIWQNDSYVSGGSITTMSNVGIYSAIVTKVSGANRLIFGINGQTTDTAIEIDITDLPEGVYTVSANFTNITQGSISFRDIQLEAGTTATPYEPHIEPTTYAVEADGTVKGIMSLYPSTTLITDNRAIIECEYNRDINKAFEELRQIIISLGGNI